ncbi:hypothetical protein [Paraburkholderia phenoliruptrix]|uniref:hypothetical protein n=1 Tax=Paraburkholderia phenoliruptrix TaxID=252970 RepID=UPI0012EDAF30|nr:hypothetical protein [Paraburkholderia phenoliruptrix]MDR6392264.1 hypothetical protein [Paraburkholderia phenoliruptrix]
MGDAIGDARYSAGRPAAEQLTAEVARHIPRPGDLAPGLVIEKTALAHDAVRFFRETVADMIADIQLMREFAAKVGDDGKRKLRVPNVMNDSLRARDRLLNTMLALSEAFYNMDRVERLHEMVIEEIGKESPDAAKRIIDRLRALNDQKGAVMLGQW